MQKNREQDFVKGAAILAIAGLISKILGAIYKIPLTNMIGTEGIGYYQPAYNIYNLLLAISLAGFPTAIARLVSEKRAKGNYLGAKQVYKVALWTMFLIGLISSTLVFIFAMPIVTFMNFPGSYYSLLALVPALLVVPVLATYRGFYQGVGNMVPMGITQVIEQIVRVAVGLFLAISLVDKSIQKAAAGATFGASIGALVALIAIIIIFLSRKKVTDDEIRYSNNNSLENRNIVFKKLLRIAIPITVGASISPLLGNIDTYFVGTRLADLGYSTKEISSMYGELSGMAYSIINFPQVFSTAIAVSLVPFLSESFALRNFKKLNVTANMGLKLALVIALPCGTGLFLLASPILALLFPSAGAAVHQSAGELLQILSISVVFLILFQAFTAMFQSVHKELIPVKNLIIALIVKSVLSYVFIGMASVNIKGAAYSTLVAYIIATIVNYKDLVRYTPIKFKNMRKTVFLPLITTFIMAIAVIITFKVSALIITSKTVVTLLSVLIGVIVYSVCLFATGTITQADLKLIPMGNKLRRFVKK